MSLSACILHEKNDLRVTEVDEQPLRAGGVSVAISRGGICGSDLHYFHHGGFGTIRVKEPIVLGHEISGTVVGVDQANEGLVIGDRVAVSPSQPCYDCAYCNAGTHQHCQKMIFMGSARTMPHAQGGFRSQIVVDASQCYKLAASTSLQSAACAEPLAVCLHAAGRAGDLKGKRVLVTGAGPIGALCCTVARHQGASDIVVTDLQDFTLAQAIVMGANRSFNVMIQPDALAEYATSHGGFDVVFECSAAAPAIMTAIDLVRPMGTIVQVGVGGTTALPINAMVSKEIHFLGTHRFHSEFSDAVALLNTNAIDVAPIVTQTYLVADAVAAFKQASDRQSAVKVQLAFD
jgi:L-idonate 5-dehydrogenase